MNCQVERSRDLNKPIDRARGDMRINVISILNTLYILRL